MFQTSAVESVCAAVTDADLKHAFELLMSTLPWERRDDIPWRDDERSAMTAIRQIADGGSAPIWRTHKAADPFSGAGQDWSHGSFVAFPPNDGAHGLGFGAGVFPSGCSFVTRFSDRIGGDRPVAGDFGLEWIAHDAGNPQMRQRAIAEATSLSNLRKKLGHPATSVHEAVGLVYETPVSRDTAAVEERLIVRKGADGFFEVFPIPDSPEWSQILSRLEQFDDAQVSQPRNFGNMPPAAAAGQKCLPVASILAKMEASGKGYPLTAVYGQRPDLLSDASRVGKKLSLDVQVDRLLDLAGGAEQIADRACGFVNPHEIMDVWGEVIDRISKGNANSLLDLQGEWKFSYPPEIAVHIVEALQDKVIGVSASASIDGLRSAVKSHLRETQDSVSLSVKNGVSSTGQVAIATAAGAHGIGRLRSRLDAVYVDFMRTPMSAVESAQSPTLAAAAVAPAAVVMRANDGVAIGRLRSHLSAIYVDPVRAEDAAPDVDQSSIWAPAQLAR